MPVKVSLFTLLLIILVIGTSMVAGNRANAQETVDTDYYRAFINTDGSLDIVDISTGAAILNDSPQFYFDYGTTNVTPTTPTFPNGDFEIDDDNDNIPDGWSIDQSYIRLSTEQASSGSKSLKFDATAPEISYRMVYSPPFAVTQNAQYTISIDSYFSSFTSGLVTVYAYCYETTDGTGTSWMVCRLPAIPTTCGSWFTTTSADWRPPSNARSFKLLISMNNSTVATVYFDNVLIAEKDFLYGHNSNSIAHTTIVNGDATTITTTDDTNPYVTINYQYLFNTHSPYINYLVTTQYKQDVLVTEEKCDFIVPSQNAQVMTKDLKLIPFAVSKTYWSNNYTPKVVRFINGLSFLGTDTMESMQLQTSGYNSKASFHSDYAGNHPHFYYVKNSSKMVLTSETQRTAGNTYSASVTFAIDATEYLHYLVKTRQPYGYDAVLTLTNHADSETLDRIKATAYGTSDESDPNYGTKGIAGRGIGWTKSVFVSDPSPYASLADANFKTFIDQLYHDGVEVVGHSITPSTDSRSVVASGLAALSQYNAKNWIDHGAADGTGNWEDLASQGAIKGDDNYILDLLDQYNYQYAWSYQDLHTDNYALNMLKPASTYEIRPFLFYNNRVDDNINDNKKISLWSTINTQKHPETYYTPDRVDSLISERGVHIGHEYLGYISCENHAWYNDNNTVKICPTFDSELEYMAGQRAAGLLWSPTMANLGDYLVPLKDVLVTYGRDGNVIITNNSSMPATGMTLLADDNIKSVKFSSYDLITFGGAYGDKEIVLPTIAPGNSVVLNIIYGEKSNSTPVIASNDTGRKKVNEITGYWDDPNKTLTMTAEGRGDNYSFTVTIPSEVNKVFTVKDVTSNTITGKYCASSTGAITFTVFLDSLHTLKIVEDLYGTLYGTIDNFFSYINDDQLLNVWHPYLAEIRLNSDPDFTYRGSSIRFEYQGGARISACTVEEPCLPNLIGQNWVIEDLNVLTLHFYGNSTNSVLPMYVKLKDEHDNEGAILYGDNGEDQNNLLVPGWHEWDINLVNFYDLGVDLTSVKSLSIGFDDGNGTGLLYLADIRLCPRNIVIDYQALGAMLIEWLMAPPPDPDFDLNNDGMIDFRDFAIWAANM